MMSKKELLDLMNSMDIAGENEKFYRFAHNYLFGMKRRGTSDTAEFFEAVKYCGDNARTKNVQRNMGISGKETASIGRWCRYILKHKELRKLSAEELRYLFGCCAHAAKANASR